MQPSNGSEADNDLNGRHTRSRSLLAAIQKGLENARDSLRNSLRRIEKSRGLLNKDAQATSEKGDSADGE